jgi:hypothetical protein
VPLFLTVPGCTSAAPISTIDTTSRNQKPHDKKGPFPEMSTWLT